MKQFILLLFAAGMLSSCERDADIPIKEIDPLLAVHALIGHNQTLQVDVQLVKSIFSDDPDATSLAGATVKVYSDTAEETFVPDALLTGRYKSPNQNGPLATGKSGLTYTVEVSYPGLPTVRGTCTVPEQITTDVEFDYIAQKGNQYQDSIRRFSLSWNNFSGNESYFRFGASADMSGMSELIIQWPEANIKVEAGKQEIETGYGILYSWEPNPSANYLDLRISIRNMDVHLYKYMRTFDLHQFSQDNPFAEPVVPYSNVEGGLGIIGAYTERYYNKSVY